MSDETVDFETGMRRSEQPCPKCGPACGQQFRPELTGFDDGERLRWFCKCGYAYYSETADKHRAAPPERSVTFRWIPGVHTDDYTITNDETGQSLRLNASQLEGLRGLLAQS